VEGCSDVFVNNAAIVLETGVQSTPPETQQVNVTAPRAPLARGRRHFRARNGGIIISMSGWAAQRGSGNRGAFAYAASQAAIENLTQRITRTFAKDNISDFIMAPGPVHT
jgi:NAD(P)-dependent dehydrogenase (short-subunit alcohol dehydrogenase family)